MPNIIDRNALSGLIPEPVTREIMQGAIAESAVLRMGKRLANMSSKTQTINVLDALPSAYFVNGEATDTGAGEAFKQTTKMAWDKKKIYAEEIAVIVPIPEAALDDADYDIWGEVRPRLTEAFGKVIDAAILFGTNKPTTWRDGVVPSAIAAGNGVAASSDVFTDIMGEGGLIAKVELDGFNPNGVMAAIQMRGKLRGLKDTTGQPIFKSDMQGATRYGLDGMDKTGLFCVAPEPDNDCGGTVRSAVPVPLYQPVCPSYGHCQLDVHYVGTQYESDYGLYGANVFWTCGFLGNWRVYGRHYGNAIWDGYADQFPCSSNCLRNFGIHPWLANIKTERFLFDDCNDGLLRNCPPNRAQLDSCHEWCHGYSEYSTLQILRSGVRLLYCSILRYFYTSFANDIHFQKTC